MIKIRRKIPDFAAWSHILSYIPERSLFFDIETTGLSAASSSLYLIGSIGLDGSDWMLCQWLADDPSEEEMVLTSFLEYASGYDTLVHFNGSTFDLPFLSKKCSRYHLADTLSEKESLDLYREFRPLKALLGLEHMNQTALQAFLGLKRADTMDGKELIPVYKKYVSGTAPELSEPLLLHNEEDLLGMTQILPMAAYLALMNGDIRMESCRLTEDICSHMQTAVLSFRPANVLPQPVSIQICDSCLLECDASRGSLRIPVFQGTLLYFFENYRDYYYLPLEDQAVHKSVAAFVDRQHRQPARPANCYTRKSGCFLPQPEAILVPSFRSSWKSRQLYAEYDPVWETDAGPLLKYVQAMLRCIKK